MISDHLGLTLLIFALAALLALWFWKSKVGNVDRRRDKFAEGLRAIVMGERRKAIKILRETAIEDTSNAEAFILIGDLAREEIGPRKALQIHHSVADRKTLTKAERVRVSKSLAVDYAQMGDHEMSADILERTLKDSKDPWIKDFLLEELEKLGRWEEAFDLLSSSKNAVANKPQLALYKVMMGNSAAESEKYHNARVLFKDAIRLDNECPSAFMRIGDAYYAEGRLTEAVEWWKKFCEKFPKIGWTCFERLERAYYDLSDYGSMITFYGELLAAHEDDFHARGALSRLFERMGRLNDAIATLKASENLPIELELSLLGLLKRRDDIGGDAGELIAKITSRSGTKYSFTCKECGCITGEPAWYCWDCGAWNSFGI
ncbi:MAG TPA: tetratricopeptide repeat protein [candidate division Zixibacteria bacterium]|nr:tetratricopeptide repeat protein [candidate division Zixibacteria bacterium]